MNLILKDLNGRKITRIYSLVIIFVLSLTFNDFLSKASDQGH
jgi:hypothetical protein